MENDRLNEIRELNPDYDISMHELDVCVGDNQYRLMYYVYVQHKESGIGVYSPTMKLYYGVACSTLIQVIREQTYNGIGLLMSGAIPMSASWTGSNIDFPNTFWSDYRMGFLTVLK